MKPKRQLKGLKIGLILIMAAVLTVSLIVSGVMAAEHTPAPATPASPPATPPAVASPAVTPEASPLAASLFQAAWGKVSYVSPDLSSIIIHPGDGSQVMVRLGPNTRYFQLQASPPVIAVFMEMFEATLAQAADLPSVTATPMVTPTPGVTRAPGMMDLPGSMVRIAQPARVNDLSTGDLVCVRGISSDNTALQVIIIRVPNLRHVQGTITAVTADSITITPAVGAAVTLAWGSNTRFILRGMTAVRTGQMAMALYDVSGVATIVTVRAAPTPVRTPTPTPTPVRTPTPMPALTPSPPIVVPVLPSPTPTPTPLPTPTPAPGVTPTRIVIDAADYIGEPVGLAAGDLLEVNLLSNPSTGFGWELVRISNPSVLQKVSDQFVPGTGGPGTPGREVWTFRALQAGTTGLFMQYSQPFAGGIKGAQTFAITVIVQPR